MAKDAALLSELHKLIGQRMDAGQIAQPSQIVEEVFKNKPLTSPHADFYRAFAKKELVKVVTRMLKRIGMSDDPASPQMVFPGHTRLVKSYPVIRNGERALVPISLCTPRELSDHMLLLRKQAKGCENHAAELEEYVASKISLEEAQALRIIRKRPRSSRPDFRKPTRSDHLSEHDIKACSSCSQCCELRFTNRSLNTRSAPHA